MKDLTTRWTNFLNNILIKIEWLDLAMLNYSTCISESTKHTPYEVIFGRLARLPSSDPLRELDLLPKYNGYLVDLVIRLNGIRNWFMIIQ